MTLSNVLKLYEGEDMNSIKEVTQSYYYGFSEAVDKTKKAPETVKTLNSLTDLAFNDAYGDMMTSAMQKIIEKYSQNDKLCIGWRKIMKEDLLEMFNTIRKIGIIQALGVSLDENALAAVKENPNDTISA